MTARSSGDFTDVGDLTERERLEIVDDRRRVREIHSRGLRCNKSRRDSLISALHADLRRFRLREHTVECGESPWAVPYTCLYALKYVRVQLRCEATSIVKGPIRTGTSLQPIVIFSMSMRNNIINGLSTFYDNSRGVIPRPTAVTDRTLLPTFAICTQLLTVIIIYPRIYFSRCFQVPTIDLRFIHKNRPPIGCVAGGRITIKISLLFINSDLF